MKRVSFRFRLVGVIAIEALLYLSYRDHDARFHWFTHFFVGASVALLVMAIITIRRRRPVKYPLAWILLAHLYAMFPDLLFVDSIPHQRWMDVFLGHISSHFIPGRNFTWAVVFSLAVGAYFFALDHVHSPISQPNRRLRHV